METDLGTRSRTGLETGFRIGFGRVSPSFLAREESVSVDLLIPQPWKHQSSHSLDQILFDINTGVQTRSKLNNYCAFDAFLSTIKPKNINEALAYSDWIMAMHEEFH